MTRLALVTAGGARLGARIAVRLAADGYALALHTRRAGAIDPALVAALAGVTWRGFDADLGDAAAVAGLWEAVTAWHGGPPDLVVNNASLFEADDVASATPEALRRHHAVNCLAPVQLAQALAATGRDGVVVNLLDQRIAQPNRDQFAYTLSKLALAAATDLLARTLAPRVRVCGVAPGLTLPGPEYSPAQLERLAAAMPLARLPGPDAVADAVAWLAGADAVTGQVVYVDGGAHLRSFERDFVFMER